jgi:hypothetical protein
MLTLLPKDAQKIIKTFQIEDFFQVMHLEFRISQQILDKILNSPYGILRGLGENWLMRPRGPLPVTIGAEFFLGARIFMATLTGLFLAGRQINTGKYIFCAPIC